MNRFNRDFALIRSSIGQIMAESHSEERLEKLRTELADIPETRVFHTLEFAR